MYTDDSDGEPLTTTRHSIDHNNEDEDDVCASDRSANEEDGEEDEVVSPFSVQLFDDQSSSSVDGAPPEDGGNADEGEAVASASLDLFLDPSHHQLPPLVQPLAMGRYSVETLLANIQGLMKIAVENARQRERQARIEKGQFRRFELSRLRSDLWSNLFPSSVPLYVQRPCEEDSRRQVVYWNCNPQRVKNERKSSNITRTSAYSADSATVSALSARKVPSARGVDKMVVGGWQNAISVMYYACVTV